MLKDLATNIRSSSKGSHWRQNSANARTAANRETGTIVSSLAHAVERRLPIELDIVNFYSLSLLDPTSRALSIRVVSESEGYVFVLFLLSIVSKNNKRSAARWYYSSRFTSKSLCIGALLIVYLSEKKTR